MGKRLLRIRTMQLPQEISQFVGTKVTLILSDGRSLVGWLLQVQNNEASLRDAIGHLHTVSLSIIDELFLDKKSVW